MLLYKVTCVQFGKNPLKDQNDSVIANTIFKSSINMKPNLLFTDVTGI